MSLASLIQRIRGSNEFWAGTAGRIRFVGLLIICLVLGYQRWELAGLTQWREDQATNLWIGLQVWHGRYLPPVGLVSSLGVPNPNGMIWLGAVLNVFSSLQAISFALGLVQLGLLARLCWTYFRSTPALFFASLLVAGTCLPAVLTGVEFWNQWILGLVNLLFFTELGRLQQKAPPFWPVFLMANCILAAPALYLAGILNSVVFLVFLLPALRKVRPTVEPLFGKPMRKCLWILMLLLHGALVWLPYAQSVALADANGVSKPYLQRIKESAQTVVQFPLTIKRLLPDTIDILPQSSPDLLTPSFYSILHLSHVLVAGLLLVSGLWHLWKRRFPPIAAVLAFGLLLSVLSPLLGGFAWGLGERPDQVAQLFLLLLVAAFGSWAATPAKAHRLMLVLALLFAGLHLALSRKLHTTLIEYRGPEMGQADLPLENRRQAVDFIAADWLRQSHEGHGSGAVPVFYGFGDPEQYQEREIATWASNVRRFGAGLTSWYADAPYTIGRGYDWELLRRWGLSIQNEGKAEDERSWRGQRYTLSMVGLPPPSYLPSSARHYEFGRVRVSVLGGP